MESHIGARGLQAPGRAGLQAPGFPFKCAEELRKVPMLLEGGNRHWVKEGMSCE